jgi:polysaccharide pyruvyl transferase WcaK-like protein
VTRNRIGLRRRLRAAAASGDQVSELRAAADRIEDLLGRVNHEVQVAAGDRAAAVKGLAEVRDLVAAVQHERAVGDAEIDGRIASLAELLVVDGGSPLDGDPVRTRLEGLVVDLVRVVRGQAEATRELVAAPLRDAEVERLRRGLGAPAIRRPGLSVGTITWNHAALLPASVASALALLDALAPADQGEVWILDDASSDDTASVAEALGGDPRVRALRADRSLGLSRARDVLLHAVPTRHALVLDADNTIDPAAAALYLHAHRTGAAFTFGPVVLHDAAGTPLGLVSSEPPGAAYLRAPENSIDTMAVIDVEAVLAAGGYTKDPLLALSDDWELLHRLARRGHRIGFVPEVVGRYRAAPLRHSTGDKDHRAVRSRIERAYRADDWLRERGIAVDVALPSPPVPRPASRTRTGVVVVSGGGVANLGDDAILVATLERLCEHRGAEEWAIDLVTDGDALPPLPLPCAWIGTLADVASVPSMLGLDDVDLLIFAGGGGIASPFAESIVAGRAEIARAASAAGVPVIAVGQGVGPVAPEMRQDVVDLFGACSHIGVRDPRSARLLAGLGLADVVDVVSDDAVAILGRDAHVPSRPSPPAGPHLLVHTRIATYNDASASLWEELADAVDAIAFQRGLPVVAAVVNDQEGAHEVEAAVGLASAPERRASWRVVHLTDDVAAAATVCAAAVGAVVGSYHLALFCLAAGRPALVVAGSEYFEGKAAGLAELLDLPRLTWVDGDDPAELQARWDGIAAAGPTGDVLDRRAADWWRSTLDAVVPASRPG